ncbi:LysR family transcriptional regulator [Vibrio sp. Isolate31]|uniref:LysR family transcriptional regulator n=1 Tax=unclassified Vibrio TaxID=2614977 RepID=UPI001EFEBC78|nr:MULTISPECIES: LysR family transcriptional regulator [unclassified Vibrio]MCG9555697.1 LysR family transcriptional regulator [Vibrio sp. Isolate32]MCG9601353.1 LysR family transcriptional regulator [Vibrio sp. Isolate31]
MKANFDDIRLFSQIVLHGGISTAAKANGMQRSKVSRRLKALESSLGTELLIRTTRNIELTGAGKHLYELVAKQVHHIEQGIEALQESQRDFNGLLRLAIPSALMSSTIFHSTIHDYSAQFPNVQIEIENHQDSVDLRRNRFDLQILPNTVKIIDDSYIQFSLLHYGSRLVATRQYLDSHPFCDSLNDLKLHRILSNRYSADFLENSIQIHLKSDDLNLLLKLALQHRGVAFLPDIYLTRSGDEPSLVHVLPEVVFPKLSLTMIYPSANALSKKTRSFIDLFKLNLEQSMVANE